MASEEPVYRIHSLVRKVQTRNHRQKAAGKHRFVQRFGGGDITIRRARPATVTRSKLEKHLVEIKRAVLEGRVVVKTVTHEVIDLDTMSRAPVPSRTSPTPQPLQDSAVNDKTYGGGVGEHKPMYPDGKAQTEKADAPSVSLPMTAADHAPVRGAGDPAKIRAAEGAKAEAAPDASDDLEPMADEVQPMTKAEKKAAKKAAKDSGQ